MAGDYFSTDTIAAVATSLAGDGGVGIIRLSGSRALRVARAVCRGLESPQARYLHRIEVFEPGQGTVLDDGLAAYFPEGQSFTGEEVVELQVHGGRFLLQSILQLLIATGDCRLALAGEFSFRAVRNGKLSLSGAEALGQLIGAKSLFEVQAARRSLGQSRMREFEEIAAKLRELLAQSELSIDFIDQDVEVISGEKLCAEVEALVSMLDGLLEQMRAAQRIARGLSVVLIGVPNAGKSTLFNALLAEERAIVSPEAGTTRDVITEEIKLGPYYVRLADTAGLRDVASGAIEKEGIGRAREVAADAEAVLFVIDASGSVGEIQRQLAALPTLDCPVVVALNKWELVTGAERENRIKVLSDWGKGGVVPLSATTGRGIDKLLEALRVALDARVGRGCDSILPTEFQLQMVLASRAALIQVRELVEASGLSQPELISAALGASVRALSDLVGETTPDTVLAKIFSEFCIGK